MAPGLMLALMTTPFRPPAVPLVTHTPYFSVWSATDKLTDDWTRHWTGAIQAMAGMVRIDGTAYRFMGPAALGAPAMDQVSLSVTATRTVYVFRKAGVELTAEFMSPLLCNDLEALTRPVTYLTLSSHAVDGGEHEVLAYLDWTGEWVVNTPDQKVKGTRWDLAKLPWCGLFSQDQPVLKKKGDNLRIDWGELNVKAMQSGQSRLSSDKVARSRFIEDGRLPDEDDKGLPRAANDRWPVMCFRSNLDSKKTFLIAYDSGYSIQLMGENLVGSPGTELEFAL